MFDMSARFEAPVYALPRLIEPTSLPLVVAHVMRLRRSTVTIDAKSSTWAEAAISPRTMLWSEFTKKTVIRAVIASIGPIDCIWAWANFYEETETIPWHLDAAGDPQLVVLLSANEFRARGLLLRSKVGPLFHTMSPGDAILFDATRVWHATAPSKCGCAIPRITANIRFFSERNSRKALYDRPHST